MERGGGCLKKTLAGLGLALVLLLILALRPGQGASPAFDQPQHEPGEGQAGQAWGYRGEQGDVSTGQADGRGIRGTDLALDSFRPHYTTIIGNGQDVYTLMIYLVGTDLESEDGAASADLREMLAATLGDKVNLLVQTGGTRLWQAGGLSNGKVQRWLIRDGEMTLLQDLGRVNMGQASTLADFLSFGAEHYPANRYGLIMWDHGGGAVFGFGWDELFDDDNLGLDELVAALSRANLKFDFIGFDACLMASLEVALLLEPYADYLISSQETEPGSGWYYTDFLNMLGQNSSLSTFELGRGIIDSFSSHAAASDTLSLVALNEADNVYQRLNEYLGRAAARLDRDFASISAGLSRTTSFADGYYDLFDIVDVTNNCDLRGREALVEAVESAVKYRNSCALLGVYGLSLYFPYAYLDDYETARRLLPKLGFGGEIYRFYDSFVSVMSHGQSFGGRSLRSSLTGAGEEQPPGFEAYPWYDPQAVAGYHYEGLAYEELEVVWSQASQSYILPLSREDWELINEVQLQILLDNGQGYLDLGSDQYWEADGDGNLLLDYGSANNTWVAIEGRLAAYYAESVEETAEDYAFTGYVPARLSDGEEIQLILRWDSSNADAGRILGYRPADYGSGAAAKGLSQLKAGDELAFIFDLYGYDGSYQGGFQQGPSLTVGETPPRVSYEDVGGGAVVQCYLIIDIYNNYAWTEAVEFTENVY